MGLIATRTELTLGVLANVGRIMRRLVLGTGLRGRLVLAALLIRMGHIRTSALEETRARRKGEREW